MDRPLVSVIVPVYNVEKYIEKCVSSITGQTYQNIEVILVNDGSKDCSLELCLALAEKDPRICVIDQENGGAPVARNTGMKQAKGAYFLFVDSDDTISVKLIERAVDEIQKNKTDSVYWGHYAVTNGKVTSKLDENYPYFHPGVNSVEEIEKTWIKAFIGLSLDEVYHRFSGDGVKPVSTLPCIWRFLYNASVIRENNIFFNPALKSGEDMVFNLYYLAHCKSIYVIHELLYNYENNANSLFRTLYRTPCVIENKFAMFKAKVEFSEQVSQRIPEVFEMWQGSALLLAVQIVILCSRWAGKGNYRKMMQLERSEYVQSAFSNLQIEKLPTKYRIILWLCKSVAGVTFLYIGGALLQKLGFDVYPYNA